LKIKLEKILFSKYKIRTLVYFKRNVKTILTRIIIKSGSNFKNKKKLKKKINKERRYNKILNSYFFDIGLAYNSTFFVTYLIQKILKRYKKQRTII
jgi:hypothetical protein